MGLVKANTTWLSVVQMTKYPIWLWGSVTLSDTPASLLRSSWLWWTSTGKYPPTIPLLFALSCWIYFRALFINDILFFWSRFEEPRDCHPEESYHGQHRCLQVHSKQWCGRGKLHHWGHDAAWVVEGNLTSQSSPHTKLPHWLMVIVLNYSCKYIYSSPCLSFLLPSYRMQ